MKAGILIAILLVLNYCSARAGDIYVDENHNGKKIYGLPTPTAGNEAATKAYADSVGGGGGSFTAGSGIVITSGVISLDEQFITFQTLRVSPDVPDPSDFILTYDHLGLEMNRWTVADFAAGLSINSVTDPVSGKKMVFDTSILTLDRQFRPADGNSVSVIGVSGPTTNQFLTHITPDGITHALQPQISNLADAGQLAGWAAITPGTGVATFLATPNSAAFRAMITDENNPDGLTAKVIMANGSLSVTASKTLTSTNTLTLAGTDGSSLNIGTGGSLGSAAFTNIGAYQPADVDLDGWATKTPYLGTVTVTNTKTFNCTNTLTLAGTDGSSLNVGTGGSLGSAAFTNTSAYQPADADLTNWAGVTAAAGIPSWLANPTSALLRAAVTDENGTGALLFSGATAPDFTTGFTIGAAAASGKILVGNGTNFVPSTPTYPNAASPTARKFIVSDGTNWVASTETQAVPGTSGNVLTSDGTNWTSAAGVTATSTTTFTNKRISPRVTTITSNATLSPSADNDDIYAVSALGISVTTINAPSGTPVDGQKLIIRVISDSSIRTISGWNAIYRFSTAFPAPTSTVASSTHTWGFMYNTTAAKWDCLAQATNP